MRQVLFSNETSSLEQVRVKKIPQSYLNMPLKFRRVSVTPTPFQTHTQKFSLPILSVSL